MISMYIEIGIAAAIIIASSVILITNGTRITKLREDIIENLKTTFNIKEL